VYLWKGQSIRFEEVFYGGEHQKGYILWKRRKDEGNVLQLTEWRALYYKYLFEKLMFE
jgi:hypothetical protein